VTRRELRALENLERRDAALLRVVRSKHASRARFWALVDVLRSNVETLRDLDAHARAEIRRRMR
jgi:hypothetical protein